MDMRTILKCNSNFIWGIIALITILFLITIVIARKKRINEQEGCYSETKKKRLHIILLSFAIVILTIGNLVIVPTSKDKLYKIGLYYEETSIYEPFTFIYSRDDLEIKVLDNDGTNDGTPMKKTIDLLDLIPTDTLRQLSNLGYKIIVDGARLAQYSFDEREEHGDKFCYMVFVLDGSKEVIISHCTPVSENVIKFLVDKNYNS